MNAINVDKTIASWRWRIVKAGMTVKAFCEMMDIPQARFSEYLTGKHRPMIDRFEAVENKLKDLGV